MIHPEKITSSRLILAILAVATAIALAGCGNPDDNDAAEAETSKTGAQSEAMAQNEGQHAVVFADVGHAVALIRPTEGNRIQGVVTFAEQPDGVAIRADLTGFEPDSSHGFHIHEFGDVTADDGTSAGGHYNPEGNPHALPGDSPRHAGDLGNLHADAEGRVQFDIVVDNITLSGAKNPVLGRAVIVHAKADDGGQPTGNAGARVAQGVIGVAGHEGGAD